MASFCAKCELEIKGREKSLQCNGFCERTFHQSCAGLSDLAFKVISEKNNVLWSCDVCGIGKSNSLRKIFDKYEKAFVDLASDIKSLTSKPSEQKISYADKVKSSEPVLVIKPKDESQKSVTTREEVKELIDPTDIEISGLKTISNGGIAIECKNKEAISKLKAEASSKMGERYNINEPRKRNPRIKIVGMREQRNAEDIKNKMMAQNKYLQHENCKINVVHVAKMKSVKNKGDKFFAYAEVDARSYRSLLESDNINIGWDICKVFDAVNVTRCFKCCGYNHKAKDCTREERCPKCAGLHGLRDCKASEDAHECINCKHAVQNLNLRINTKHAVWDPDCPVYKRNIEIARNRVNFLE